MLHQTRSEHTLHQPTILVSFWLFTLPHVAQLYFFWICTWWWGFATSRLDSLLSFCVLTFCFCSPPIYNVYWLFLILVCLVCMLQKCSPLFIWHFDSSLIKMLLLQLMDVCSDFLEGSHPCHVFTGSWRFKHSACSVVMCHFSIILQLKNWMSAPTTMVKMCFYSICVCTHINSRARRFTAGSTYISLSFYCHVTSFLFLLHHRLLLQPHSSPSPCPSSCLSVSAFWAYSHPSSQLLFSLSFFLMKKKALGSLLIQPHTPNSKTKAGVFNRANSHCCPLWPLTNCCYITESETRMWPRHYCPLYVHYTTSVNVSRQINSQGWVVPWQRLENPDEGIEQVK